MIIFALLCFVQESQILQICYNVEHFSDTLFHILICNNVINLCAILKITLFFFHNNVLKLVSYFWREVLRQQMLRQASKYSQPY